MNATLGQLAESPAAFRNMLLIDTDSGPRVLSSCLDDWQAADFAATDAGWMRAIGRKVDGGCSRAWLERPRGHSKTSDVAAMITWALFAASKPVQGVAAAGDADQARLLRDAIARLAALNPWLGKMLDVQRDRVVNKHVGSALTVLSSDAATSYGLLVDFAVVDEIAVWANRELFDSILSAVAKKSRAMMACITNAGWVDSWVYGTREAIRGDGDWYFHAIDGPVASWISAKTLAEQKRLLPAISYQRLWLNQWGSGSGDALASDDITAAVDANLTEAVKRLPGWKYTMGVDLSLSRDASAVCVVGRCVGAAREVVQRRKHPIGGPVALAREMGLLDGGDVNERRIMRRVKGDGSFRLARLRLWKPSPGHRINLESIEQYIRRTAERFDCDILLDAYQAASIHERLVRDGFRAELVQFTMPVLNSIAQTLLSGFADRTIKLYNQPDLVQQLGQLRIEEKAAGVRLVSPRTKAGHGDAASAFGLAIYGASREDGEIGDYLPADYGPLAWAE
jgi:phage terminase large subunit-like protein